MIGTKFGAHTASAGRNVLLIALVRGLAVSGAAVVPNLPLFLNSYGQNIWTIESCFAIAMLLAMVPSGHLADRLGDRRIIQLGALFLTCGSGIYVFGNCGEVFCVAEIFLGLGHGFILGSDESLLHRSLTARGVSEKFPRYWTKIVALEVVFCSGYLLVGDWLASLGERLPMVFSLSLYVLLVLITSLLEEPASKSSSATSRRGLNWIQLYTSLKVSFTTFELRSSILWCAVLMSTLRVMFWSYSEYLRVSGASVSIGVILAIGSLVTAFGSVIATRLTADLNFQQTTRLSLVVVGVSLLTLGTVVSPWSFLLVFLHYAVRGVGRVYYAQSMHRAVTAATPELRATVTSIREMSYLFCYLILLNCARVVSGVSGIPKMMFVAGILLLLLLPFVGNRRFSAVEKG